MVLDVAGWMSLLRLFGALGNVNLRFEDARARKPQFSLHVRSGPSAVTDESVFRALRYGLSRVNASKHQTNETAN
jgi:hypothetical protein